ncbi:MAG: hypothetical protein KGN02_05015 [bacterium]|nr:hypothetical protein [bacterium]
MIVRLPEESPEREYASFLKDAAFAQWFVAGILAGAASGVYFPGDHNLTLAAYVAVAIGFLRASLLDRTRFKRIFFGSLSPRTLLLASVSIGIIIPGLAVAVVLASGTGQHATPGTTHALDRYHGAMLFLPLVLAPIAETALLTVWLQTAVQRSLLASLIVGTLVFVGIHLRFDWPLLAFAFGISTARSIWRSSGVPLLAHAAYNTTLAALLAFGR